MKPLLADKLVVSLMGSMGVEREEDATALFSSRSFDSGPKEKKTIRADQKKKKKSHLD